MERNILKSNTPNPSRYACFFADSQKCTNFALSKRNPRLKHTRYGKEFFKPFLKPKNKTTTNIYGKRHRDFDR